MNRHSVLLYLPARTRSAGPDMAALRSTVNFGSLHSAAHCIISSRSLRGAVRMRLQMSTSVERALLHCGVLM